MLLRMATSVGALKVATQIGFCALEAESSRSDVGRRSPGRALWSSGDDFVGLRRRSDAQCAPFRAECSRATRCYCWSSQKAQGPGQEKKNGYPGAGNVPYVNWFREAWPYIQGHRGSTFVIVIPGEVVENRSALESILQVGYGRDGCLNLVVVIFNQFLGFDMRLCFLAGHSSSAWSRH